jgi:hypothetical protein
MRTYLLSSSLQRFVRGGGKVRGAIFNVCKTFLDLLKWCHKKQKVQSSQTFLGSFIFIFISSFKNEIKEKRGE